MDFKEETKNAMMALKIRLDVIKHVLENLLDFYVISFQQKSLQYAVQQLEALLLD